MASAVSWTIRDYSDEHSNFGVDGTQMTAGNFAAQDALIDTLRGAIAAIIVGNIAKEERVAEIANPANSRPTDPFAQREMKWLVGYSEVTSGEKHTVAIATPDLANLVAGTDLANLTDGDVVEDFVTAFEAYVRVGGTEAVTVDYMRLVGRNI